MDRSTKLGTMIICLFALPFAGFGLFALGTPVRTMLSGDGNQPVWLPLIFGIVFGGVGLGLMFLAVFGSRFLKKQQRAQAEHPSEPWLWREDWAAGRIKGSTRSGMISGLVFAILWNLISASMLVFIPEQAAKKPVAFVGLVFPAVGVLLLVRAIRSTLAYAEFGKTVFEMSPVPGVIGGELKGVIQARFPHSPEQGVQVRLSCVRRVVTGSGNSRSASENILWRGESSLSSARLYPGPAGTSIPVCIRIPWESLPTDNQNPENAIVWMLEARADVPGVDYDDVFEVPIFRTAQTPAQPPPDGFAAEAAAPVSRPDALTIEVRETAGGTEFYFPAARNKGFDAMTTVFFTIFSLVTFFLVRVQAPFIFPLAFGGFSTLLLFVVVQMWFGTTRAMIGNGVLRLQSGLLGGGKVTEIAFGDIASIGSKIGAQQGGGTGTPYYDIELLKKDGRKLTLGRTLQSKQETDWLVAEMQRLAGVQSKAAAAGGGIS